MIYLLRGHWQICWEFVKDSLLLRWTERGRRLFYHAYRIFDMQAALGRISRIDACCYGALLKICLFVIICIVNWYFSQRCSCSTIGPEKEDVIMSIVLVLRGFVVIGVMLMHTAWYFRQEHNASWVSVAEMLLDIISLFAVPLVMFVSGYIFISRHRHADHYKWSFFKKMCLSVLMPYVLFSLLYMAIACCFSDASYSWQQIGYLLLTGSSAVHMGFFRALFGFYAAYPLLLRWFNHSRWQCRLPWFFMQVMLLQLVWKIANNMTLTSQYAAGIVEALSFLRYVAYFCFGMAAYIYRKAFLRWIDTHHLWLIGMFSLSLPAVVFCWLEKYYWHGLRILDFVCLPLNLLLYSITIAVLFRYAHSLEENDCLSKRLMIYLGNYSFGLFLIHIIYMYAGSRLLTAIHLTPRSLAFYPLLFIIMLGLSLLSVELLAKKSWGCYWIGRVASLDWRSVTGKKHKQNG